MLNRNNYITKSPPGSLRSEKDRGVKNIRHFGGGGQ